MIIETILSLYLFNSVPAHFSVVEMNVPINTISQFLVSPVQAKGYSSSFRSTPSSSFRSTPSSSFRSTSSSSFRSTPSSSFRSTPSSSFRSTPSSSFRSTPSSSSSPSSPSIDTTPNFSSGVVRINKQKSPTPSNSVNTAAPTRPSTSVPSTASPSYPNTITRETYIERSNDSGIIGNPFFWMYLMDNNRNNNTQPTQQPPQIIVKNAEGENVKVPESQLVVRKYSYNPLREFLVFALGGGIGVFLTRKFSW